MGFLNNLFNKKNTAPAFLYTEAELDEYENFITERMGNYDEVFHELVSPDIHLDVIIIAPTENEPYYKLITEGAGAFKQNAPGEHVDSNGHYAEYMILLPPDWNVKSDKPSDYWPIGELKKIARIPIDYDTWLGTGHTIHSNAKKEPIDASTELNSFILFGGIDKEGDKCELRMKSGKLINFYLLMPLYQEELEYKMENGSNALLDRVPDEDLPPVVNPKRKNYVTE